MKLVVLRERGSTVALAFMVVFMVIFLAMFGFMLVSVQGGSVILLGFFAFFMAMMLFGVYALLRKRWEYRRVQNFAEMVSFSDSSVSFPESLEFEVGRLEMRGYWVGSGRNRSYRVERKFTTERSGRSQGIAFPEGEFKVAIDADGSGIVTAPAVRLLSDPYKDVLLIFLTDSGRVVGEWSIQLSHNGDSAEVVFKGEGKAVTGHVQAYLSKARKVRWKSRHRGPEERSSARASTSSSEGAYFLRRRP
ncbi:hypothetical protein [Thermococcus pacificus]|uniref:Uncharacterized protein n=1 Tax=Thermococcus pacificus TaxID=71998 RepID=A0A218P5Z9_9EURY|nr:hypothetical protein [Thermococcus pacificus]ASJ06208.1 hypothetical protein A3L08_02125 [Thermococcus pacificus]